MSSRFGETNGQPNVKHCSIAKIACMHLKTAFITAIIIATTVTTAAAPHAPCPYPGAHNFHRGERPTAHSHIYHAHHGHILPENEIHTAEIIWEIAYETVLNQKLQCWAFANAHRGRQSRARTRSPAARNRCGQWVNNAFHMTTWRTKHAPSELIQCGTFAIIRDFVDLLPLRMGCQSKIVRAHWVNPTKMDKMENRHHKFMIAHKPTVVAISVNYNIYSSFHMLKCGVLGKYSPLDGQWQRHLSGTLNSSVNHAQCHQRSNLCNVDLFSPIFASLSAGPEVVGEFQCKHNREEWAENSFRDENETNDVRSVYTGTSARWGEKYQKFH